MSTFGAEMKELITELAGVEFASQFEYQHITSVENATTFATEQTITSATYVGAFSEPGKLKLFSPQVLEQCESAVVMPVDQFGGNAPKMFDKVQVSATKYLRVVGVSEYLLPGGNAALPLSGGYALALAS